MPAVPAGSYIVANKSPVIENENSGFEVRPDSSLYRSADLFHVQQASPATRPYNVGRTFLHNLQLCAQHSTFDQCSANMLREL